MPAYKFTREGIITRQEMEETLAKTNKLWLKALVSFLYVFGVRISEALRLKKEDFVVEGDKLVVTVPLLKKRTSGPFTNPTHILKADLNTPFVNYIVEWINQRQPGEFMWPLGRTWASVRKKAWMYIKELNPNVSPHIFRHTRLTKLALRGATGPDLMDWAGWSDLRPATKYLHAAGKLAEKFSDKLD